MKLPKGTNETLKGHRLGAERWLINCRKAAVDGAGCRLLSSKMWHSVPFFMPCHCTWRCKTYVRCWQRECYACTLLRAIFPHKMFVPQKSAVSGRLVKSMCHAFALLYGKVSFPENSMKRMPIGQMLKMPCTPTDFSFFIFHFSFIVVPLQPNSENPMHSTPGAPLIDGLAGGRM